MNAASAESLIVWYCLNMFEHVWAIWRRWTHEKYEMASLEQHIETMAATAASSMPSPFEAAGILFDVLLKIMCNIALLHNVYSILFLLLSW